MENEPVGNAPTTRELFPEKFALHDGRMLEVRPTTADDNRRLEALYTALPRDDARRRFFSAGAPKDAWCRTWASVTERGGFGVIALVYPPGDEPGGHEEVVGEAGYAMRPDGDGELAVTIATGWRGWLGPYLLDVIVRHAALVGVTSLQADVLLDNTPMLQLLRHRGAVALDHPDGTVHLSIGTSNDVPSWPPSDDRRRVLVEINGGRWVGEDLAHQAGLSTVFCSGPDRRRRHGCPVLQGGTCPLADGADAIVVLLDPAEDTTVDLVAAHRRMNPSTPVLVRTRTDAMPAGCHEVFPDAADTVAEIISLTD